jgi:hypothetical protein
MIILSLVLWRLKVPIFKTIPVADLVIDSLNPRLEDEPPNQQEAIQAVAARQKEKLATLAEDIVEHGINPSDSLIVMPTSENQNLYIVLEGNRRLSALKALDNPKLHVGVVDQRIIQRFQELNERYKTQTIERINCVVFENREKADHWIELRHTGENEGAGIVRWGAHESARFRQRRGERVYYLQALDFLEEHGKLSSEERQKVPVSSLERILSNPDIRAKLGLDMKNKILYTQFDEDEVAEGLSRIVNDLATGRIRTGDIYHKEDRIKYVNQIEEEELPDTSRPTGQLRPLATSTEEEEDRDDTTQKASKRSKPSSRKRSKLIPRGFILDIEQTRINEIYHELKKLHIINYSNAVAVLFRVFLELSLDDYIERKNLGIAQRAKLSHKLLEVGKDLENKNRLSGQQLKAVRRFAQTDTFIAASINTFHQYVHNSYFTPTPIDLKAAWDDLSPFIKEIWDT